MPQYLFKRQNSLFPKLPNLKKQERAQSIKSQKLCGNKT